MLIFLTVLHVICCVLLICLVLLQDPKGGAAGGIFGGGGSNSLLGATGGVSFLAKVTRGMAIGFGVLCLTLTWYLKRDTGSVLDALEAPAGAAQPAPAAPGQPATTETAPAAPAETAPAKPADADAAKDGAQKTEPPSEKK